VNAKQLRLGQFVEVDRKMIKWSELLHYAGKIIRRGFDINRMPWLGLLSFLLFMYLRILFIEILLVADIVFLQDS
jgi:hypothetical protein